LSESTGSLVRGPAREGTDDVAVRKSFGCAHREQKGLVQLVTQFIGDRSGDVELEFRAFIDNSGPVVAMVG